MDFEAFVKILGEYAPLVLAESWDNVGMIVEPLRSKTTTVTTVMLCIDLTLDVCHIYSFSRIDLHCVR